MHWKVDKVRLLKFVCVHFLKCHFLVVWQWVKGMPKGMPNEWLHFKWQPQAKGKFELSVYTGKFFGFCTNLVFRSLMFTYWQPQGIASLLVFNCCRFPYLPLIKLGEVGPHHLLSCLILLYQLHLSISSVLQFVFGG